MTDPLIDAALAGDPRSIARIATWIENREPRGISALDAVYPYAGSAHIVGITGPPGAGKSSLIDRLITDYRESGVKVAVVAVDPSSTRSGGAALGDRIRMSSAYGDDGVFVRSMASRGQSTGIALGAGGVIHLLDAAGFDVVILETVGVGQDQTDIVGLAHTVVLLQTPGSGDAIQFLKAGILEHADIIVVNKGDLPSASILAKDLRSAVSEAASLQSDWAPSILVTSASENAGIKELREAIDGHYSHLTATGGLHTLNLQRAKRQILMEVARELTLQMAAQEKGTLGDLSGRVANHEISASAAAAKLLTEPPKIKKLS